MRNERVLDASALGAALFEEVVTRQAQERLQSQLRLVAPDLLFPEMVHLALKKVRGGHATEAEAAAALRAIPRLLSETLPSQPLNARAFDLALTYGLSGYDATYVALSASRDAPLVTADLRLARRLEGTNLAHLVEALRP